MLGKSFDKEQLKFNESIFEAITIMNSQIKDLHDRVKELEGDE